MYFALIYIYNILGRFPTKQCNDNVMFVYS